MCGGHPSPELDGSLYGFCGLWCGGFGGGRSVVAVGLAVDAVEDFARAFVGGGLLYGRDDVVVVEVLGAEQVDVRAALVALALAVAAIVAVAAVLTLGFLLLLGGNAGGLLLRVAVLAVAGHAVDAVDAEAGGQDGDLHALAQLGVGGQSPLDFEVVAELAHEVVHVVHLLHHQRAGAVLVAGKRDAEQDLLGVEHVVLVEQRRVEGVVDGFPDATLALAVAGGHNGHAAVLEHGLHVVEVEVDESMDGDDLGYGLGGDAERVVGLAEGVEHGELGVYLAQAFVVDDQEGVDVLRHLLDTVQCLVNLAVALEAEGNGDDAYGEDAHLLRHAGNDGSGSGARAAAHAGSDEGHARAVVKEVLDVVQALFGSGSRLFGAVAGTKSFLAQLQVDGDGRVVQRLVVGITQYEGDIVDAFAVHVVDGIAATSTNAYHLDYAILFLGLAKVEQYVIIHLSFN